jgi:hypothetical protein
VDSYGGEKEKNAPKDHGAYLTGGIRDLGNVSALTTSVLSSVDQSTWLHNESYYEFTVSLMPKYCPFGSGLYQLKS